LGWGGGGGGGCTGVYRPRVGGGHKPNNKKQVER
jgi:hypothetical protein